MMYIWNGSVLVTLTFKEAFKYNQDVFLSLHCLCLFIGGWLRAFQNVVYLTQTSRYYFRDSEILLIWVPLNFLWYLHGHRLQFNCHLVPQQSNESDPTTAPYPAHTLSLTSPLQPPPRFPDSASRGLLSHTNPLVYLGTAIKSGPSRGVPERGAKVQACGSSFTPPPYVFFPLPPTPPPSYESFFGDPPGEKVSVHATILFDLSAVVLLV